MTIHNGGICEIRDKDGVAFFHRTVEKRCPGCRRTVKVLPRCASRPEQGLKPD